MILVFSYPKKNKKQKFNPFASDGDDMPLVPLAYPCIIVEVYYYIESQLYSPKKNKKSNRTLGSRDNLLYWFE